MSEEEPPRKVSHIPYEDKTELSTHLIAYALITSEQANIAESEIIAKTCHAGMRLAWKAKGQEYIPEELYILSSLDIALKSTPVLRDGMNIFQIPISENIIGSIKLGDPKYDENYLRWIKPWDKDAECYTRFLPDNFHDLSERLQFLWRASCLTERGINSSRFLYFQFAIPIIQGLRAKIAERVRLDVSPTKFITSLYNK